MNRTRTILLATILLSSSFACSSQDKSLLYDILRNEKKVGRMYLWQRSSGDADSLKMECTVNAKLIASFNAEARETAVFNHGVLVESSIYRKLNGAEKANKKHRAADNGYIISNERKSKEIKIFPITHTMLSLYTNEPVNVGNVYSDNFESMVPIEKIESHKYKVTLPDDSYNSYLYKDGTLIQMEIHHPLYAAKFVLVNKG